MTDQGMVYNPKTQIYADSVAIGEHDQDGVAGVRVLQVAGRYILGGADSKSFGASAGDKDRVDSYFLLDTQARKRTDFSDYNALVNAVQPLGILPHLERIAAVYSRYRFSWFEVIAGILFVVPPLVTAVLLVGWILRLRRTRAPIA